MGEVISRLARRPQSAENPFARHFRARDALEDASRRRTRARPFRTNSRSTLEFVERGDRRARARCSTRSTSSQARAAGDDLDRGALGQKAAQEPDRGDGYRLVSEIYHQSRRAARIETFGTIDVGGGAHLQS